jgi:hypothetical protein
VRDVDERIYEKAEQVAELLVAHGIPQDEAVARVVHAMTGQTVKSADAVVRQLLDTQEDFLEHERRLRQEFDSQLRADWGEALDAFYVAAYCMAEAGERFVVDHQEDTAVIQDDVVDVLYGLLGRARRVAFEIHHLLSGGFPLGATARARTLHELAVTGLVIGEYGRRAGSADLARRYLDHEAIARYRDAKEYQNAAAVLNIAGVEPTLYARIEADRAATIARYGIEFKEPYGWAAVLTRNGKAPKFDQLERLANLSHFRSDYQWMCHEVHAGAMGLSLNLTVRGGEVVTIAGPTNVGFGDPGEWALRNLMTLTSVLFTEGLPDGEMGPTDLLALKTVHGLVGRFAPLAEAAEAKIMAREAELNHEDATTEM